MALNLDDLTRISTDDIFEIEKIQTRTYEKGYDVQMDITVEMNLSLQQVERSGYNILDLLSDVGGIQGLLVSFIGIILGVMNYNNFDNFMASRLYKIKDKPDNDKVDHFEGGSKF